MSNKIYEGKRGPNGLLISVVKDHETDDAQVSQLSPRTDLMKHTPNGAFECGFKGSGPSQLALAILADHLGDASEAVHLHLNFRDRVIVDLPRDRDWRLTKANIDGQLTALRSSITKSPAPAKVTSAS
jgi:hypothetical protein